MNCIESVKIRQAKLSECEYLSQLALRSKAVWGYSKEYIDACRPHIKVDEEYIENWPVRVLEDADEKILGFYSLKFIDENRLDNLWLEPSELRKGFGSFLYKDAVKVAKELGWSYFRLAGEQDAIGFYERQGARLIGQIQSRLGRDIFLPHMEMTF